MQSEELEVSTDQLIKDVSEILDEPYDVETGVYKNKESLNLQTVEESENDEKRKESKTCDDGEGENLKLNSNTIMFMLFIFKLLPFVMPIMFYSLELFADTKKSNMFRWDLFFALGFGMGRLYSKIAYVYRLKEGDGSVLYNIGFTVLKISLAYNIFISLWYLTFIFHVLEEVYLDYLMALFVTCIHVFITVVYMSHQSDLILLCHIFLFMFFPINDPISVGAKEAAHRSILSTVLFVTDVYFYKIGCKRLYDEKMLINVIIPIWKGYYIVAYVYFICYFTYRVYNIRKHSSDLLKTREDIVKCFGLHISNILNKKTDVETYTYSKVDEARDDKESDVNIDDDADATVGGGAGAVDTPVATNRKKTNTYDDSILNLPEVFVSKKNKKNDGVKSKRKLTFASDDVAMPDSRQHPANIYNQRTIVTVDNGQIHLPPYTPQVAPLYRAVERPVSNNFSAFPNILEFYNNNNNN